MATVRELGVQRMKEGRFAEAAAALSETVAENPGDVGAWRLLGGALSALEDAPGAVAAFQRTVALDPNQPKNHYNLALALQALGNRGAARHHFQQALALDPGYEQATQRLQELDALPARPVPPPPPSPPLRVPSEPPVQGYGYGQAQLQQERVHTAPAPTVNGTNILVLGILGVTLSLILSPFAWYHGNRALELLDRFPEADQSQRNNAQAGRILGIVGTVILLFVIALFFLIGMAGGFR